VFIVRRIDKVMSTAIPGEVWRQMVATSSTCYDVVTFSHNERTPVQISLQ